MSTVKPNYTRALDLKHGRVDMSHGSGGRAMAQLITELFAAAFDNEYLAQGNDGALLPHAAGRLVMATDSHVVSPLFFAGRRHRLPVGARHHQRRGGDGGASRCICRRRSFSKKVSRWPT